jgi:membrane peptidoglycan carboxypeptidase
VRLLEGVLAPILQHRRMQGGSTLTMQMARSFFLSNERSVRRKWAEIPIAIQLKQRFTKPELFAMYVNQVDLGQRGSFDIRGVRRSRPGLLWQRHPHAQLAGSGAAGGFGEGAERCLV